jgi:mannosyl-3-phosphoglycerate phosphatase
VLNSSKTLAELAPLRVELGLADPVIAENGAFIDVPEGYFTRQLPVREPPPGREVLQRVYRAVKQAGAYRCEAFCELAEAGIVAATGLDPAAVRLANDRRATEPVLWQDTADRLESFCAEISAQGLQCLRGGRFVHVMGRVDKASAMQDLMSVYRQESPGEAFTCIALGDGPNDAAMLAAADVAVVVRARHGQQIDLAAHRHVVRTQQYGPLGWQNALNELLEIETGG